ncbi:hypothetical protein JCM18916_3085 [Cutibacterium acnes JCM 18916]|nr:hypothetical protein JCM18916_3085 [Cutibacterium acnes JCM 18916]GAE76754.1 hypothetical protein JCM18918_2570 [Cutibacterium acnes JCM 18918]
MWSDRWYRKLTLGGRAWLLGDRCIERQLGDGKPSTRDDQDFPSLNMESKISGA